MSRRALSKRSQAEPVTEPESSPAAASRRRRLSLRWLISIVTVFLLIVCQGGAAGYLCRKMALSAMEDNRPHAALAWLDWAVRSESLLLVPPNDSTPRLQALAFFRLNLRDSAVAALEEAARRRGDARRLGFYHDLAAAHHGEVVAVERLTEYGAEYLPPQAVFEGVIRHGHYHGHFDWAIGIADMWIAQFPDDGAAFYHRGRMHETSNRFEAATKDYQAALDLHPHLHQAAYRLGMVLKKQWQFDRAEQALRNCLDSPYDSIARLEIADALWEQSEYEDAWAYIEAELERSPLEYADHYRQVDDFVADDRAAITAARILESQNRPADAIPFWKRALRFNRRNPEGYDALVAALRRSGRDAEAEPYAARHQELLAMRQECSELRIQISDNPGDIEARVRLAELYAQCESLASAHLVLREVLAEVPGHSRARQLQAEVFRQKADADRAFRESLELAGNH